MCSYLDRDSVLINTLEGETIFANLTWISDILVPLSHPSNQQLKIIELKNENSMQIIGNVMFFVDVFVVSVTTNGCNMFTNLFREIIGAEIAFNSVENGVFQNMETLCANLRGPSLSTCDLETNFLIFESYSAPAAERSRAGT